MSLVKAISKDIRSNKRAGLLAILYLINYRLGRAQLHARRAGRFWVLPTYFVSRLLHKLLGFVFGCSIPFSANLGQGIVFPHGMFGIFISGNAAIGCDCTVLHHVTIGSSFGAKKRFGAPAIGSRVFISAGAKIIGPITVEDDATVGANAVVVKNVRAGVTMICQSTLLKSSSTATS